MVRVSLVEAVCAGSPLAPVLCYPLSAKDAMHHRGDFSETRTFGQVVGIGLMV